MQGASRRLVDVPKRAIIDVNSIVSGRNYDILTSIIAQLVTSRQYPRLKPHGGFNKYK